jgi:hypothetical protein
MSQLQTRVHIAAPVEGTVQRCARCGIVLINSAGAMGLVDDAAMSYWQDGGYVGIVEVRDDARRKPVCSMALASDAIAADEIACR